ncbi:hypothetical protein PILCRDRAFT_824715 [Piloderma croceum F 1598]|uniref:Uncharacterized protein n=1 Tax=Piloderma croceum (strain F 1598) TaxID=765440 RepID=A0A0C3FED1_PILCF|nr:hypothetical protein PILCRDRAFT_824715 [Piloderma croceum F 1598]
MSFSSALSVACQTSYSYAVFAVNSWPPSQRKDRLQHVSSHAMIARRPNLTTVAELLCVAPQYTL